MEKEKKFYLTTNTEEFYIFNRINLNWVIKENILDLRINFIPVEDGEITESYLVVKSFINDGAKFSLNSWVAFLVFKNESSLFKERVPSHINLLKYSEFLNLILEKRSFPSIKSGDDEYAELVGIELRFKKNEQLEKIKCLPMPSEKGCTFLLRTIKNIYENVY